jgi:hypothetical protein
MIGICKIGGFENLWFRRVADDHLRAGFAEPGERRVRVRDDEEGSVGVPERLCHAPVSDQDGVAFQVTDG